MPISELMTEDREALEAAIANALPDETFQPLKKKAQQLAEHISDELEWNLKENLAANLAYHVREMAGRAVEALLAGNESEMVRWLSCDKRGYTGRDRDHSVIHGKLFETGCIALRRSIVDAHKDLITSERILDLEDQVSSLVAQVNKLSAQNRSLVEKYGNFA